MMGIFGFCDVRNFTVATECLQEDIMIYINCIAEYVHAAVNPTPTPQPPNPTAQIPNPASHTPNPKP